MRVFGPAERQRRLAQRHALTDGQRGADPAQVAGRLVALHGTDPATVFLSVLARMPQVSPAAIEEALYERRTVIRMLAMRRTVFVVPAGSVPVVQASTTNRIAADQRARLLKHLQELGEIADPDPWLADVESSVLEIFAARREPLSAAELSAAEPRLKTTLRMAAGKSYETTANITSRVLLVLSAQGHLVRGRPIGTWLSQQYRWSLAEDWLPATDDLVIDERAAKAELARHWLTAFGPAPAADLKWWTGWTQTQVRQALADLAVTEVELAEGAGVALPDDLDDTPDQDPWVALLPALDPTVMGWADRSWFLGPHAGALFDTNGNAGPTIWLDGKVVGGWAQRKTGEVVTRILTDVGTEAEARVQAEAARVQAWLGPVLVIPRFRTPTERELSG